MHLAADLSAFRSRSAFGTITGRDSRSCNHPDARIPMSKDSMSASPTTAPTTARFSLVLVHVSIFIATISLLPSTATSLILNYTTRGCSKHCESINCNDAPTIRYGKFCGVGYTGCSNQTPCDRLDSCCRQHDLCVGSNPANFLNQTCRSNLRSCLQEYLTTGAAVYKGSKCTALTVQNTVMVALESTTFHHSRQLAPEGAPQSGRSPSSLQSISSRLLLIRCIVTVAVSLYCIAIGSPYSIAPLPH